MVVLGGDPTADKAGALIAWARRDATGVIEGKGAAVGAAAGLVLGLLISWGVVAPSVWGPVVVLYGCGLGAVLGVLAAVPVYLRMRPDSRLQPVMDHRHRVQLRVFAVVLLLIPLLVAAMVPLSGGPKAFGKAVRVVLGSVWGALGG